MDSTIPVGTSSAVTVLVCTLNEAENVGHVLPKIPEWVEEVLVVDGGSTDGTVEMVQRSKPNARVVRQPGNGKGDAIRYGVQMAEGDIVVTLDADGETDPGDISAFIAAIREGSHVAKGSRLARGRPVRMPVHRWVGNKLLAHTYNILFGTDFSDVCSGFNAFRRESFFALELTRNGCELEQQMLARARKAGMVIREIPHKSAGRIGGLSKVRGLKQGIMDWFIIVIERLTR